MTLHSAEREAAHLDRAIERLQGASAACLAATHPGPHAAAQFNLGMAPAIRAGPDAPPQAAVAHANLGSMLFGMAKQDEPDLLREAAHHLEQALATYTSATNPQQHQEISNNLALVRRRETGRFDMPSAKSRGRGLPSVTASFLETCRATRRRQICRDVGRTCN